MSTKSVSKSDNGQTETKTYVNGRLENIQHTDNDTGKTHEHNVERGGLLGVFGPYTGTKK